MKNEGADAILKSQRFSHTWIYFNMILIIFYDFTQTPVDLLRTHKRLLSFRYNDIIVLKDLIVNVHV